MAAVTIKRKRGRPRRDEPTEINDFDIALIREFAQRPAFYDRSCVHYRNRDHIELQWEEMAKNLGYNVSLIRDRMIQLRNRYNLEKRRVETMQDQYNDPDITSQWPLYEYMTFLGDHIKSRRPYSNSKPTVLTNAAKHNSNNSNSSSNDEDEYEESQHYATNESDTEQQNSNKNNYNNSNHIQTMKKSTSVHLEHESNSNSRFYAPAAPIPSNQTNTTTAAAPQHQQQQRQNQITINPQTQQRHRENSNQHHEQQKRQENYQMQQQYQQPRYHHHGVDKFKAFGQFLAASLIELNEIDALRLVDKFTSELVREACMQAERKSNTRKDSDNETDHNISV